MKNNSEHLIKSYLKLLQINVKEYEKIEHEEALSSTIFKLTTNNLTSLILKISFDKKRYQREVYFLDLVKNYIPVPKIIKKIDSTQNLCPAILMEYIEGNLILTKSITDDLAYKMGILLASLHEIPATFYGDICENQKLSPSLESGLFILKEYFDRSFKECINTLDSKLLKKIKRYFYDSLKQIKHLDGPHIIHKDFKPGNIITKNNQIKALIDWENAKYGFSEEDFSQMEYLVWDKYPRSQKAFINGYKSIRKMPDLEIIMPIIRVAKALGAIKFTIERNTYDKEHKFVFDQNYSYLKNIFLT